MSVNVIDERVISLYLVLQHLTHKMFINKKPDDGHKPHVTFISTRFFNLSSSLLLVRANFSHRLATGYATKNQFATDDVTEGDSPGFLGIDLSILKS